MDKIEKYRYYIQKYSLPFSLFPEALQVARQIQDKFSRAGALLLLFSCYYSYPLWQETISTLSAIKRPELLEAIPILTPYVLEVGGIEALREMAHAIGDVCRWWK